MKKIVLIDGHAIIHRAFHAIQPLTTSTGELVNAVYGFTSMLLNVLEIEKPDCIVVTFDKKGPTFRHRADETYKATRSKTPDELIRQIKRVYEIVRAFNIPIFAQAGFEADDMIAALCEKIKSLGGYRVIIVSGDRDLLQLVDETVSVHDLTGGYRQSTNFTPAEVQTKYGFAPQYIPDYKGLVGDTSDNLAGVMGVGPKGATGLIEKYGSLEKIYEHLDEVPGKLREKLETGRESAFHSKKMATLRRDAQLDWDIRACEVTDFDREKVLDLLTELEFKSLAERFRKLFPPAPTEKLGEAKQQSLF